MGAFRSALAAQIPSDLGYGAQGSPPKIPGGATLIFQARPSRAARSRGAFLARTASRVRCAGRC